LVRWRVSLDLAQAIYLAGHGADALLSAQTFDAALLDVNLKGEISYPVAGALIAREVPFVFTTGYSDHGMRDGYRDWPVLKKPYKFEKLAEMLTQLVSR
jgi:CheY-like chemotaxis protein